MFKQPEHGEMLKLRQNAISNKKIRDRDSRKRDTTEKKKNQNDEMLIKEILSRGIKIDALKSTVKIISKKPFYLLFFIFRWSTNRKFRTQISRTCTIASTFR